MILRGHRPLRFKLQKRFLSAHGRHPCAASFITSKQRFSTSRGIFNLGAPENANRHFSSRSSFRRSVQVSFRSYGSAILLLCCGAYIYTAYWHKYDSLEAQDPSPPPILRKIKALIEEPDFSAMPVPSGYRGNLSEDQEKKLRELWSVTLKVFGVEDHNRPDGIAETPDTASEADVALTNRERKKSKKHISLFKKKDKDKDKDRDSNDFIAAGTSEDKYGQVKEFHDILESTSAESLRRAFWSMVKADHPDGLLLRFLRARKWDVDRALVMLISTMKWRAAEMQVDDDIMKNGEGRALEDSTSSNSATKKEGDDFLAQLRMGKSFLHGIDKQGRPLCIVRVRLHRQGEQSEKSLERYTVFVIETARLLLKSPVETACIIFDMTHFTMANMDYTPVKFMIKVFEANYPESLGAVLVHKSPWIFQSIWNIIKGWLDPVVAGKVHFTKNAEDLEQFIPRSQILKELGGDEDWEYHYIEPVQGENSMMNEEAPRLKLEEERRHDVLEFQKLTFDWVRNPSSETIKKERDVLAEKLNSNYWALDPYIRARSLYDRQGVIQKGGNITYYPSLKPGPGQELSSPNGNAVPTHPPNENDVD